MGRNSRKEPVDTVQRSARCTQASKSDADRTRPAMEEDQRDCILFSREEADKVDFVALLIIVDDCSLVVGQFVDPRFVHAPASHDERAWSASHCCLRASNGRAHQSNPLLQRSLACRTHSRVKPKRRSSCAFSYVGGAMRETLRAVWSSSRAASGTAIL